MIIYVLLRTADMSSTGTCKSDYYVSKLMDSIKELSIIEYCQENYGECAKRCIQWLRLYSAILPRYRGYVSSQYSIVHVENDKYSNRLAYILKSLDIKKYDSVLNKYMDCNKFLVGPIVYQLVQKINTNLPNYQQWDVFMTFSDMVELDRGVCESFQRDTQINKCYNILKKVNKYVSKKEYCENYRNILKKVHFNKKKSPNVEKLTNAQIETESTTHYIKNTIQCNIDDTYDIVDNTESYFDYEQGKELVGERLTFKNAKLGQIVSYATKKTTEYGRVVKINSTYVELERLIRDENCNFTRHHVPVCKSSKNKPQFTRVINIIQDI